MRTISGTDGSVVFGYVRVSTVGQVKDGHGLEVQEDHIRAYCTEHGLTLAAVYRDEGESGANGLDTRAGLAEAIDELVEGRAAALVVYRLDRLARDLILQETVIGELKLKGVPVISCSEDVDSLSDDPTRMLVRQVMGAISQWERALIRIRMAKGLDVKRSKGGYTGGKPPLGRRAAGGELVVDPAEAKAVARIIELRAAGSSYRQICATLTTDGHATRRGGPWRPAVVRAICERAAGRPDRRR